MPEKGFTLIEVIVAVFVLTIGVVGVFALVNQTMAASSILTSRLIAAYLAQEGIEIARNIRDGNFLEAGEPDWEWADGLPTSPKDRRGDYLTFGGLPAQPTPL